MLGGPKEKKVVHWYICQALEPNLVHWYILYVPGFGPPRAPFGTFVRTMYRIKIISLPLGLGSRASNQRSGGPLRHQSPSTLSMENKNIFWRGSLLACTAVEATGSEI